MKSVNEMNMTGRDGPGFLDVIWKHICHEPTKHWVSIPLEEMPSTANQFHLATYVYIPVCVALGYSAHLDGNNLVVEW